MKNEMGSFFTFLFTELKLPQGPRPLLTHTHTHNSVYMGGGYEPLSHIGNTKRIYVMQEKGLAA